MIRVKNLYKTYQDINLFEDFNIEFEKGQITALLGASGSGKTTLIRMIAGLEFYEKGKIEGLEEEIIGMIFQEDRLVPWLSVYENIEFVLKDKMTPEKIQEEIKRVLEFLELWEYRDYMPQKLSGGMQRRVAMGRAFAYPSTVLLMDEPFKGLDDELRYELMKKLMDLWKHYPKTIILITHNKEEAEMMAQTTYLLKNKPVICWKK